MLNDKEDDVEDEESDHEYENDIVLEEIGEESDQQEATDTGEKSDRDQDYDESDNESDVGNDQEDDEDSDKDNYDDNDVGDNEGLQISDILCTTKSGRTCRTQKARYLFYYFGEARSKGFATLWNVSKLQFLDKIGQAKSVGFRLYSAI